MKHDLKHVLAAIAGLLILALSSTAYGEVRLRNAIVVEGSDITLGDLFKGVGELAFVAVRPAPEPGERLSIRTRVLQEFARGKGLDWQVPAGLHSIQVERAGRPIPRQDLEAAIRPELRAAGASGSFEIDLQGRGGGINVPPDAAYQIEASAVDFDRRTSRFSAALKISGSGFATKRLNVAGYARKLVELPVLTRRLGKGVIIRADDLSLVEMRASQSQQNTARDESDLIGLETKRALQANRPIRLSDVQTPVLVKKGALVTMLVRTPSMSLSAVGQALEDGAMGEVIRILNPKSHKTVQGTVVSKGQVQMITRGSVELALK